MKKGLIILFFMFLLTSFMSAQAVKRDIKQTQKTITSAGTQSVTATTYDFTTGSNKFFGGAFGATEVESGVWGMIAGDGNGDGSIDAQDYNLYKNNQGTEGYEAADYNLDGGNYAEDYTLFKNNQGSETEVP